MCRSRSNEGVQRGITTGKGTQRTVAGEVRRVAATVGAQRSGGMYVMWPTVSILTKSLKVRITKHWPKFTKDSYCYTGKHTRPGGTISPAEGQTYDEKNRR